ncbi:hypothetical protein AB3S75_034238 [Citrus x aurantiifolia]
MGDNSNNSYIDDNKIAVLLIGVGSAAFVIAIYHCISVGWYSRCLRPGPRRPPAGPLVPEIDATPSSIENSMAQLIPAHKYHKGTGPVGDEDGMCAVCLSEFEEGEELRTLPECLHSYHAPCIDMWLYSHSNCPICRSDATPSPQILRPRDSAGPEDMAAGMVQNVDVQSRTM